MPAPFVLVAGRVDAAEPLARALHEEAGAAFDVRAASPSDALALLKGHPDGLVGVVAVEGTGARHEGLDVLSAVRRARPQARRILVASGALSGLAGAAEFERLHAAFEAAGRYSDISSGILQELIEASRALGASET